MNHSDFLPALKPAYPDLRSCDAWVATAALGDSPQACSAFLSLLHEIDSAPPPRETYLQMLEHLLPTLLPAIGEQTRRFAAKPLPLSQAEMLAFSQVSDLWLALLRAYRRLLRAAVDAEPAENNAGLPLLAARAAGCASELIAVHFLARKEPGPDPWQWLHVSYAFAEARGLDGMEAASGQGNSCAAAYAQALLFALAQPQSLSQRDMFWTRAWARRFAGKVRMVRVLPGAPAYAVDLGGGAAWRVAKGDPEQPDGPVRYLDTEALGYSLRKRLRRLDEGDDPAALGLGQGCTQPGASALLRRLISAWCAAPAAPRFPRRAVPARHAAALLAVGFTAVHAAIDGKPFSSEAVDWNYNRRDEDDVHAFQRTYGQADRLQAFELRLEHWLALDESANGFRLERNGPGARVAHRQLLALKAGGAPHFMLAEVRWMMQHAAESLVVGVQLLPGLARACAARTHSEEPGRAQPWSQSLLLPLVQGKAPSLVLPASWYQRDRLLELRIESGVRRVRLFGLIERGFDYDRVSFTAES